MNFSVMSFVVGDVSGKEPAFQCWRPRREESSIPGSGKSPGEGHGNPLQYSHLEIPWTEGPGGLLSVGSQESNTTNTTWNAQETTGRFCRGNSHYLAENLSAPRRTSCNGGRLGYRRGPSISAFTSK